MAEGYTSSTSTSSCSSTEPNLLFLILTTAEAVASLTDQAIATEENIDSICTLQELLAEVQIILGCVCVSLCSLNLLRLLIEFEATLSRDFIRLLQSCQCPPQALLRFLTVIVRETPALLVLLHPYV